jgi:hypothetical protein
MGCGGSIGDLVAQQGMWWLRGDVVAQLRNEVAQLVRPLGEPDCNAAVPGSIPLPHLPLPHSHRSRGSQKCQNF